MSKNRERLKENVKLFFKSAALTAIGILLIVVGFFAAGYFFGS